MASRRRVVTCGVGTALLVAARAVPATPELRDRTIADLTQGAPIQDGRVHLTIPGVAENGFAVYTTVAVDSPMTADDHVLAIHVIAEANPIARLVTFRIGPRAGRAKVSTNIRLAASQSVTALAELSDGTFWRDVRPVLVTLAACIDGG
jgi:sulfur-oxidizing protein SoxY